jgi:hypothetical protein
VVCEDYLLLVHPRHSQSEYPDSGQSDQSGEHHLEQIKTDASLVEEKIQQLVVAAENSHPSMIVLNRGKNAIPHLDFVAGRPDWSAASVPSAAWCGSKETCSPLHTQLAGPLPHEQHVKPANDNGYKMDLFES